jgi:hypothetical protein
LQPSERSDATSDIKGDAVRIMRSEPASLRSLVGIDEKALKRSLHAAGCAYLNPLR